MRSIVAMAVCAAGALALTGCGKKPIPPELVGSWKMVKSGEEVAHLFVGDQTFNADGTWHGQETTLFGGSLAGEEYRVHGTFEVKGKDELIITRKEGDEEIPIPLYYEVKGDTLTTRWQLNQRGADTSVVYMRVK